MPSSAALVPTSAMVMSGQPLASPRKWAKAGELKPITVDDILTVRELQLDMPTEREPFRLASGGVIDRTRSLKFTFDGKEYTPQSFAQKLGINPDDYVLFTSFTHHPFYQKFILELPDNWSWGEYYNVPIDELIAIMDNSLNNDYTLGWAADVSEKGFSFRSGVAIVPDFDEKKASSDDWEKALLHPTGEKSISQTIRQEQFDNFTTTDDHGMHITGLAQDQNGKKFYLVKNSWGTGNVYNGYLYVSEAYVRYKTVSILVNKNTIPKEIRNKFKDLQ